MSTVHFLSILKETKLIAILRGISPTEVIETAQALVTCGFKIIEVPLNTPQALESISKLTQHYRDQPEIIIGAGTVCSTEDLNRLSELGCDLVISPHTDREIIHKTKSLGMISCPGFTTATEAYTAIHAGADLLKLFPFSSLGTTYYHDLVTVLPRDFPLVAVGGITEENICDLLIAGIPYFGIGSALYHAGMSVEEIKRHADRLIKETTLCRA